MQVKEVEVFGYGKVIVFVIKYSYFRSCFLLPLKSLIFIKALDLLVSQFFARQDFFP